MLTHMPLVRIDAPRVEIGGGALVALPFADYDELVLGAFTDSRRDYESTAPVFFLSEHDTDAPDDALDERIDRHLADCARVRDALALAAPSSSIPDPALTLRLVDIPGDNPVTQTLQGHADQELLFLGAGATFLLTPDALDRAAGLLDVVDRCDGELRQAIDVLHGAADLSSIAAEQLTLCAIELEALLLPDLTSELKQTFARRLAHLLGGPDTEALARAVYEDRSDAVHGEAAAESVGGVAQTLLAGAVVALEALTRDGTTLADIREGLDAGPVPSAALLAAATPPPAPRILHAPPRRWPPASRSSSWASGRVLIGDPEIDAGNVVLFAPLIGLELDDLPDPLIDAGFPLSWMWPGQLSGLEDPDIRRDWMSRHEANDRPLACLALTAPGDFKGALDPLRHRADTAVTVLRLAGVAGVHDPDLLGVYAGPAAAGATVAPRSTARRRSGSAHGWDGRSTRRRSPTSRRSGRCCLSTRPVAAPRRSTMRCRSSGAPTSGSGSPPRRGSSCSSPHWRRHSAAVRSSRSRSWPSGRRDATPRRSSGTQVTVWRSATASPTANGRPAKIRAGPGRWADLLALLGEVLPALLMAWRARRKARPAKTLVAALRDPQAELDWRVAVPSEPAERELQAAREQRYQGLDTSVMVERGQVVTGAGDVAAAAHANLQRLTSGTERKI